MTRDLYPTVLAASGLFVALTTEFATAKSPVDLENHKPAFHWTSSPSGQQSICDGDMHVADFYGGSKEMRGIGRPISLHNLRLIPDGPLAIAMGEACGPLCLSWRKHLIFYMNIDELSIDEKDPERFKLYVRSHDVGLRADRAYRETYEPDNVIEETWLELTYDKQGTIAKVETKTNAVTSRAPVVTTLA